MKFVVYSAVLYLSTVPASSWNVESTKPVIYQGDKDSHFGYSVAFNNNSKGNFALIAATKANSSYPKRRSLHQPGVLYKCEVSSSDCEEVVFEKQAQTSGNEYLSNEDDMWLGVSLDVKPGGGETVVCAHLWKNEYHPEHYLTNGACYLTDNDFKRNKTLLPLIYSGKQQSGSTYLYAFAQVGASVVFSEEGDLVIGAPGFYDWIGTVISYKNLHGGYDYTLPIVPYPTRDQKLSQGSYIGYSISTGKFFKGGREQFVTGAPRDGNYKGRVYIFEPLQQRHNEKYIIIIQRFEGESTGEYFGASVLGVDINGDTYTDLLVGSPFYSLKSGGDEGKVYVYMSSGMGLQKTVELMGSSKSESRFGTSIANAGDLNQDGFTDVAIGAPYEDGAGAVYIYHGDKEGLTPDYVQRIDARETKTPISGFGIAISRGKDIDGNKYPDLLVGAYLSDKAFLFRTRPVVRVKASLTFFPTQINTNSSTCRYNNRLVPCFKASSCFVYDGKHVPSELNITVQLRSARKRDILQPRRYLMYQNKLSSHLRRNITLNQRNISCFTEVSYVVSDSEDFITPIQMALSFKLTHSVNTKETFCSTCPILDPAAPHSITNTITFQTACGEDSTCYSDLKLKVNISGLSSGEIVLGETNLITLHIELENYKEAAYMAEVYVVFPETLQIINQGSCREQSEEQLVCNVGNPLKSGNIVKREIKFDTSSISSELHYIEITVKASTASEEINKEDNEVKVEIPTRILADITITGRAEAEQIIFNKASPDYDQADIAHIYTVQKFLPSPITSVSVDMLVPTAFAKSRLSFLQLKSIGINEASISAAPASCNFSQIDLQPVSEEIEENGGNDIEDDILRIATPRPKRAISKRSVSKEERMLDAVETSSKINYGSVNYVLSCSNSICTKISCVAGPFMKKSTTATFRISGYINITTLQETLTNWDRIVLTTEGKVAIVDQRENMQPKGHLPDEAKVTTVLVHAVPLPAKRIAFWIVAVSIAAGVILLVLLLLGMIKLGFFRRKKKEDMEKMMVQAELEEWESYLVSNEQVKGRMEDNQT